MCGVSRCRFFSLFCFARARVCVCVFVSSVFGYSSAADPGVMTDYVMALVKWDRAPAEWQKDCEEQLKDFLGAGAASPVPVSCR